MLLTHGHAADLEILCAAVLLDGVLGGHVEIAGRRVLGVDRRRVVPGAEQPDAPRLMGDLRRRAGTASPAGPGAWLERLASIAHARVAAELEATGAILEVRHARVADALWVTERAEAGARERLEAALAGDGTPSAVALGAILHAHRRVIAGRNVARVTDAVSALPPAARTVIALVEDARPRHAPIGP